MSLQVYAQQSIGPKFRRLRLSEHLTHRELAGLAHVSTGDVRSLERGLPLRLDAKRALLRELWARKVRRN